MNEKQVDDVLYIRMERKATGSFLTFKLPRQMQFNSATVYAERLLQQWEAINGCLTDPDETF